MTPSARSSHRARTTHAHRTFGPCCTTCRPGAGVGASLVAAALLAFAIGVTGCNTFTPPPEQPSGTGGAPTNGRGGSGIGGSTDTGAGGAATGVDASTAGAGGSTTAGTGGSTGAAGARAGVGGS